MSFLTTFLGLVSRVLIAIVSRFVSPKDVIVDIGIDPQGFVQENLKKQNLKYRFSRKDQVIARQHDGWRIAQGRKWLILTEYYVDVRDELVLMCKDK